MWQMLCADSKPADSPAMSPADVTGTVDVRVVQIE